MQSSMAKPPTDSSRQSSSKRKKDDDDQEQSASSKKQRTRVSFSCGECHRRKQRCDRQMPCAHVSHPPMPCIARKVPELCKPYTPGKSDQDISLRLLRLERIIEAALPHFCTPNTPGSFDSNHIHDSSRLSLPTDEDNNSEHDGTFQSGKWYGNSASGSIAPSTVIEQLEHAVMPVNHSVNGTDSPDGFGKTPMKTSDSTVLELEPSAADNLKLLVQECGVSPHKISELIQELPPQRLSDALIDFYFKSINWTRYPLSEQEFRTSYTAICANGSNGVAATNPNDVRFLPLLFVVLAIAARLAPEQIGGDARQRRVTSLRYYWSSRRSLLIAAAIQPDSLDIVLTRLLSARFLTFDRRITECWSQLGAAVRTAQALGLHRDGSSMSMETARMEQRRRIWSYLYHADRSYALVLGRPHAIQDEYTSTHPPSNIDDANPAHSRNPPPLSVPTPMTFVILRQALASIIGKMVHHFQKVRPRSEYGDVIRLDDELSQFISQLPPHFSMDPDRSLDETLPFIPAHRFLLITEVLFVRVSLHRPYLLRKLHTDRYTRSRTACFDSALKDFEVRQAFRKTCTKDAEAPLSNAYREFQTAMISGIYLVLQPRGKDAEAMHTILDGFLKDNEGIRDLDETTRRELKIIEFLKKKSSEAESNGYRTFPSSQSSTPSNPIHPAAESLLSLSRDHGADQNFRPDHSPASHEINTAAAMAYNGPLSRSPTFQRVQQTMQNNNNMVASPVGSGSPGDDEPSAQSLLDNWCNSVNNMPGLDGTSVNIGWPTTEEAAFPGWASASVPPLNPNAAALLNGYDGNDWSYWEALVNHIHRGP